jgi:ubiquinone/menaquinone biosynthesis C-methylase UbiE
MDNPAKQTRGRTLDHAAGLYDILSPLVTLGREPRLHRRVVELLALDTANAVLDVGCATGTLTTHIARECADTGGTVIGIDAAAKMIAAARRKHGNQPNLAFDAVLAENLPYEDGAFDRVVSTFFFHHVDRELKARSLAEMHRVLRPGGFAVVVDVDVPTHWFGASAFASWRQVDHHLGYVSTFVLEKE